MQKEKRVKIDTGEVLIEGEPFIFMIPKDFGGGILRERYQGGSKIGACDWYELLAIWNLPEACSFKDNVAVPIKRISDETTFNRKIGLNIGFDNTKHSCLQYPLRFCSIDAKSKVYEDYNDKISQNN